MPRYCDRVAVSFLVPVPSHIRTGTGTTEKLQSHPIAGLMSRIAPENGRIATSVHVSKMRDWTYAPQEIASLFDHLARRNEERIGDGPRPSWSKRWQRKN